ncbi:MAG: hypothetical protein JJU45_08810 [Acidimicrobiia bacterium]|nr:hypothetical protein [Acidimicrobiia bacterium]
MALVVGVTVGVAGLAFGGSHEPALVDPPTRVYTSVNLPLPFAGADPISLQERNLVVDADVGNDNCVVIDEETVDATTDCIFVQLDVNHGTLGLIDDDIAIVSGSNNTGGPFNIGGSLAAVNTALGSLTYEPATDWITTGSQSERLRLAIQDANNVGSGFIEIEIRVKDLNEGPTISVPSDVSMDAGDTKIWQDVAPDPDDFFSISDPDLDQGFVDDVVLAIVWVTDGEFNLSGSGSVCAAAPSQLLLCPDLPDLPPPLDDLDALLPGVLDGLPDDADFGVNPGLFEQARAWGLVGSLGNVNSRLSRIEYTAPANDCECRFTAVVTDLGNNGMPLTGEIPDIGIDVGTWLATVLDDVNDPPVLTVPAGPHTVEINGALPLPSSVADPDAGGEQLEMTVSATGGTTNLDGTTMGTLAELNALLDTLVFTAGATAGAGSVTINVDDLGNTGSGGAQSDTAVLSIEITDSTPPTTSSTTTSTTSTTTTSSTSTTVAPTTTSSTTSTTVAPTTTSSTTSSTTTSTTVAPTTTSSTTSTTVAPTTTTSSTTSSTTTSTTVAPTTTTDGGIVGGGVQTTSTASTTPGTTPVTGGAGGSVAPTSTSSQPTAGSGAGPRPMAAQTSGTLPVTGGSLGLVPVGVLLVLSGLAVSAVAVRRSRSSAGR